MFLPIDIELRTGMLVAGCLKCLQLSVKIILVLLQKINCYCTEFLTRMDIRNQSDFKLLDNKVVAAYCRLPERERFFRGLVNWMNFSTTQIFFDVPTAAKETSSWKKWALIKYLESLKFFVF